MPTKSLELQHYDLALGMQFVALWLIGIFGIIVLTTIRSQYKLMNTFDAINSLNPTSYNHINAILNHIKRVIFSVMGYQGEERERQVLSQLDAGWIVCNFSKIFLRFSVFYFVYIWALILTTRALLIDPSTSEVQVLPYTSKQIFGFFMIIIYILSNSLFEHFVSIFLQ